MDLEDRESVKWIGKFTRDPLPKKVVWFQDDVLHHRFYWLALPENSARAGQHIVALRDGQTVKIEKAEGAARLCVRWNDEMADLDKPVTVVGPDGRTLFEGMATRQVATIQRTLSERGDPASVFSAEVAVDLD
jgi:hypothetical protein